MGEASFTSSWACSICAHGTQSLARAQKLWEHGIVTNTSTQLTDLFRVIKSEIKIWMHGEKNIGSCERIIITYERLSQKISN